MDAVGVKKGLDSSNQILLAGEAEAVSLADIVRSEVLVLQLLVFSHVTFRVSHYFKQV